MQPGQELTHTITTTVNSETQHIVNETTLKDGETVLMRSQHEVNIPIGETYEISVQGDVNSKTIERSLNVLNNLVGADTFFFDSSNQATDTSKAVFSATYDPGTMTISGTAPLDSTIRILLEDGSSIKTKAGSDSRWQQVIIEDQLQYGVNNIAVIAGIEDSQIIVINIQRDKPVEPYVQGFDFIISKNGQLITGTAQDIRAKLSIVTNSETLQVEPGTDLTWKASLTKKLAHGEEVSISEVYDGDVLDTEYANFYDNAATLNQSNGNSLTGTADPLAEVIVVAPGYDQLTTEADESGLWSIVFSNGLVANDVVSVTIDGVQLPSITYTGQSNVNYALSVVIDSETELSGTAQPGATVTIIAGANPTFSEIADENGIFNAVLAIELQANDSVFVSSNGESDEVFYLSEPGDDSNEITGAVTSSKTISGTGSTGETITVIAGDKEYQAQVDEQGAWLITLDSALSDYETVTITNGINVITATYKPEFTAYIGSNGDKVLGTSKEDQVTVTINGVDSVVNVVNGKWELTVDQLQEGEQVTVVSGDESKQISFTAPVVFTAELSAAKDKITGQLDAAARIRLVFLDNTIIDQEVAPGPYEIPLNHVIADGDPILVAVITNNAVYSSMYVYG